MILEEEEGPEEEGNKGVDVLEQLDELDEVDIKIQRKKV